MRVVPEECPFKWIFLKQSTWKWGVHFEMGSNVAAPRTEGCHQSILGCHSVVLQKMAIRLFFFFLAGSKKTFACA